MMITMMQNMFQGNNAQMQRPPIVPPRSPNLPYPPATTTQSMIQTTTTPISAFQTENEELVEYMEKTTLAHDSDNSSKRHKTPNNMELAVHPSLTTTATANPTPIEKMNDSESSLPL